MGYSSRYQVQEWLRNSTEKVLEIVAETSYQKELAVQQIQKKYFQSLAVHSKGRNVEVTRLVENEPVCSPGNVKVHLEVRRVGSLGSIKHCLFLSASLDFIFCFV